MNNIKCLGVLFVFIFSSLIYSQSENWNVLTLQRELFSINILTQNKVWIFAGDYSYKSSDGGVTWSIPAKNNVNVGISGGSYNTYPNYIYFADSLYGWVTQKNSAILRTTNGGITWTSYNTNLTDYELVCVQFIDRQIGFTAGKSNNNTGAVARTTNGGINWTICTNSLKKPITSLYMINNLKGFASSSNNDTISQTNDGWNTLEYKKAGNGQWISKIYFLDSLQGWLLGNPGFVSKTTNGGEDWQVYTASLGNTVNMYFVNPSTGWITSTRKRIFKTTNGGVNWFNQLSAGTEDMQVFRDIYFKDPNTGWALGTSSNLLRTTNGGGNWYDMFHNPDGNLKSVYFSNENTGWCVSSYGLWKTTNRGYNWVNNQSIPITGMNSVDFININTGFLCGADGNFMKTTDGGVSWIQNTISSNNLSKVCFIDNNTGFICGANGIILKTINSGMNWLPQQSSLAVVLNDIQFTDQDNGFIAADNGYILKTTNGGVNWVSLYPYNNFHNTALHFVNNNTGYAVSNRFSGTGGSSRLILKTTDSGSNWSHTSIETHYGPYLYTDVFFINDQTGWITSSDFYLGYISKTTNGGVSWFQTFGPIGSGTGSYGGLYSIFGLSENKLWIAGDNGTVLSTSSPVGIQTVNTELPNKYYLNQNYPNPFNPQTKIKFSIPLSRGVTAEGGRGVFVSLIIYDLLGREVAILVNEELRPGTYEADWDGSYFSSGVYFFKLMVNDPSTGSGRGFVETKKMVLMK